MEGLIPIVYRAIKRRKTRSRYECLSAGASQTYNIADFYDHGYGTPETPLYSKGDRVAVGGGGASGHRRYNSAGEFSFPQGGGELDRGIASKQKQQQLVRFRSNRMFSCITGAS